MTNTDRLAQAFSDLLEICEEEWPNRNAVLHARRAYNAALASLPPAEVDVVSRAVYESAVQGRRDFREALRKEREKVAALTAQCEGEKSRLDFIESGKSYEVSCDYDDNDEEWFWAVHSVLGINDRQWHLLGRGKTLRAAIDSAIEANSRGGV